MFMNQREQRGGRALSKARSSVENGLYRRIQHQLYLEQKCSFVKPVPEQSERQNSSRDLFVHLLVSAGLCSGLSLDGPRCCGLHVPSYQRKVRDLPCHDLPSSNLAQNARPEGRGIQAGKPVRVSVEAERSDWTAQEHGGDLIGQPKNMGRSDWAAQGYGAI